MRSAYLQFFSHFLSLSSLRVYFLASLSISAAISFSIDRLELVRWRPEGKNEQGEREEGEEKKRQTQKWKGTRQFDIRQSCAVLAWKDTGSLTFSLQNEPFHSPVIISRSLAFLDRFIIDSSPLSNYPIFDD